MILRILYNALPITLFGVIGYVAGKTIQIYKAAQANPELYTDPNPSWISQASAFWMIAAAAVLAVLIIRMIIKRTLMRGA